MSPDVSRIFFCCIVAAGVTSSVIVSSSLLRLYPCIRPHVHPHLSQSLHLLSSASGQRSREPGGCFSCSALVQPNPNPKPPPPNQHSLQLRFRTWRRNWGGFCLYVLLSNRKRMRRSAPKNKDAALAWRHCSRPRPRIETKWLQLGSALWQRPGMQGQENKPGSPAGPRPASRP